jgi:hypothetical protein
MTAAPRTRARHTVLVVAVAVVMTIAGGLGTIMILEQRSGSPSSTPPVVNDGPTLYEALRSTNVSVDATMGGPWTLEQVYGVASPIPADPGSWGWGEYDQTLVSCQAAFNGLTIWNGTMPLFNGTFNSGTAPFWQIVYYSNSTQQLLVATDVSGEVRVYAPIPLTSECAEKSGLGYEPWLWKSFWSQDGYPGDTPTMASDDWNVMAHSYVDWLGRPVGELYLFGADQFGSGMPHANQINYFTCGTTGAVGATPGLAIFGSTDEPNYTGNSWNYTLGCTPTTNSWTPTPLEMAFSNTTVATGTGTMVLRQSFTLIMTGSPPYSGPGYNSRGITSWMVSLNLTNRSGDHLPISGSGCGSWVPSLTDCIEMSGWYAVLLGPDGTWDGSYGATHLGQSWTYPVLPIANNETIAVIIPSTWNVTGDTLEVTSTTSELPLSGSVTFA